MAEDLIEYKNVSKRFEDVVAASGISFSVESGEFVALLGPSGAGKTTVLRMFAGFETPTEGRIELDGRDVTSVPPHKRDTSMVFQDYALFPHMTVGGNVAFGLKNHGYSSSEREERIERILEMMGMADLRDRKPSQLSGGQQQRVATARAVAVEPKVLLMDEPLGALDKKLRDRLQLEIVEIQQELGITTLYVTHNQSEALTMADRIAVFNEGRIVQIDTPTRIYNSPATEFVADFIGDTNFLPSSAVDRYGITTADDEKPGEGEGDTLFVRPEALRLEPTGFDGPGNCVSGRVDTVVFLGSKIRYFVDADGLQLTVDVQALGGQTTHRKGDDVCVVWDSEWTRVTGK